MSAESAIVFASGPFNRSFFNCLIRPRVRRYIRQVGNGASLKQDDKIALLNKYFSDAKNAKINKLRLSANYSIDELAAKL